MPLQQMFTEEAIDELVERLTSKLARRMQHQSPITPRLLTVQQAAAYLSRMEKAVRILVSKGNIPVVRTDGALRFDVKALDRWIEQRSE